MFERIVCFSLQILIGQLLLVGWLPNSMDLFAQTYWMFLIVLWAGYRLGWKSVVCMVVIAGVQAFYGDLNGVGVFGNEFLRNYGLGSVTFLLSLLIAGLVSNIIFRSYHQSSTKLESLLKAANIYPGYPLIVHQSATNFAVTSEDVTQLKLIERLEKLLLNAIPDALFLTRCSNGQFIDVNHSACEILGYSHSELRTMGPVEIDSPEFQGKVPERIKEIQTHGKLLFESAHITKTGEVIPVEINSQVIHLDGHPVLISLARDCRKRKQSEDALHLTASVFAHARESVIIADVSGNIINVNNAFCECTGYTQEEVLGKNPRFLSSGYQNREFYHEMWQTIQTNGSWKGEIWNRTKDGEIYAALLNIVAVKDGLDNTTHYIGLAIEITHIREYQKSLEYIAQHDVLTGLPNRLLLSDRLQQAIEASKRNQLMLAVCYLDLDGFKPINDKLGHQAGDFVLVEIAKRLSATVRQMDTVSRLGGDEYVLLLQGQEHENDLLSLLDRLLVIISAPILIDQHTCAVSASIGVSVFPHHAQDPDTLIARADSAMYRAKYQGKNCYALWQSLAAD